MKRRDINASDAPQPVGGYSQAVELTGASRILLVSGQIPVTADNKLPGDFETQARQAWANLIAQLHAADTTLDRALALAIEVETLAEVYWRALQVCEPELLSDAEMGAVMAKFASYGSAGTS